MSDSWLDHIPSHEREKIRKRLRSPEEYERLREKVKGPEDLAEEMKFNESIAELRFGIESEPDVHDALKNDLEMQINGQGIEKVLERSGSEKAKKMLEQGKFRVTVSAHPSTHQDQLMVVPEGNVQEKIPVKKMLSDRYAGQFRTLITDHGG